MGFLLPIDGVLLARISPLKPDEDALSWFTIAESSVIQNCRRRDEPKSQQN
jgi:hypothetical protein